MQVEHVTICPLCRHSTFRPYKQIDEWGLVRCRECGLVFLNPRPNAAEQKRVYSNYYGYPPMPTDPVEKRRLIDHEKFRVAPLSCWRSPGRLLDVGCGSGTFMALAREYGWTVTGTEIAPHCVTYAREELGLDVVQGDLLQLSLSQRFDAISLNHVLEHMTDPVAQVQAAKALLEKDGLMYVSVPNHRCFDARREGLQWEGWALPWHFYHYSPATLRWLLESCGLRAIRIEYALSREFNRPSIALLRRFLPREWQRRIFSGTNLTVYATIDDRPLPI